MYYHQMINNTMSVSDFYTLWPNRIPRFYILTNDNETHDGFHYINGINHDDTRKHLWFFVDIQLLYYQSYAKNNIKYIREVSFDGIPDATILVMQGKCIADKLMLSPRRKFSGNPENYIAYLSPTDRCLEEVRQDGRALQYIPIQTEEICICAVSHIPEMLYMVKKQTRHICMEAVKRNGMMLRCVKHKTLDLCQVAVKNTPDALEFCTKQTEEMCRMAVRQNGLALRCVKHQTEVVCAIALQQNKRAIKYVKHLTPFLVKLLDYVLV